MNKRDSFIKIVQREIFDRPDIYCENYETDNVWENACLFWEAFTTSSDKEDKPLFTDNGKLILNFLKDNQDTPLWKAKDIAENLLVSSRTVAGAMRKLVTDGFVEKVGKEPTIYSLTEKGKNIEIN